MTLKEAKAIYANGKAVQHKTDFQICGEISCFDDEETGVYIRPFYSFVTLRDLKPFDIHDYASRC